MTDPMTPAERELWDAHAAVEAWDFTLRVLEPWVASARAIGHPELTSVMIGALEDAKIERQAASEVVEELSDQNG